MKLSEMSFPPPKILLMGGAGVGKTALAMTLGSVPTRYFDFDGNLQVGISLNDSHKPSRLGCDVTQYFDKHGAAADAFQRFKTDIIQFSNDLHAKRSLFKACVVDSLTMFFASVLRYQKIKEEKIDDPKVAQNMWNWVFNHTDDVMNIIRALPCVVVLTAHDQLDTQTSKTELALPGKNMPQKVPAYFSEFWYMKIKPDGNKSVRVLQTQRDFLIPCRSGMNLRNEYDTTGKGLVEILKEGGYEFK